MNKEELTALVAQILTQLEPPDRVSRTDNAARERDDDVREDAAADITQIDLRTLYLTQEPADGQRFASMKRRTPARLGMGRAGARYRTLTMLRFRADHAAAQDAVFSEVAPSFAKENGLLPTQTRCDGKEQYLTRPDLGRCFDEANTKVIRGVVDKPPRVQLVVGDGLSAAAIEANAMDCLHALKDGLRVRGIETEHDIFVRYCRVGAGDAIGDITGCELVCMLVGERPGLATDKSMSIYITYRPHSGISESCRSVISNIHAQGTPAVEAGAYAAELIEKILQRKASGVALHLEAGA